MPPSKTTSSRNGVHLLSSWPKCSHRTASQAIARAMGCSLQPARQALSLRETRMSFTQRSWLHAQLEASPLHWLVSVVLGVILCAGRGEKESLTSPCYKPGDPKQEPLPCRDGPSTQKSLFFPILFYFHESGGPDYHTGSTWFVQNKYLCVHLPLQTPSYWQWQL